MKKNREQYFPYLGNMHQKIRKMKLTLILTLLVFVAFGNSYSQVKVSLRLKKATIQEVIGTIEQQTDYIFLYKDEIFDLDQKYSIDFEQASFEEVLNSICKSADIEYEIRNDRQIILKEKKGDNLMVIQQKMKNVTGVVTGEDGLPIPGVSIIVAGTTIGTVTNSEGKFTLEVPESTENLQFTFVGLKTQNVDVSGKTQVFVVMEPDAIGIEEVVAVGYGTQKKMNVTGSVATVSTEELENRPIPKMGEVLRGISPNLNISLTSNGGEPGASSNWNIRGLGSLSGNDSPLVLVDGVEMNINNIDPANVKSVSVLKDASASAIYGARAPFGVILITTKKGKSDGSISVQYNNNFSFGTPMGVGHLESSVVYAAAYNQASINAGSTPIYNDEYLALRKSILY